MQKAKKLTATVAAVLVAGLVGSAVVGSGSQAWAFDRSWTVHSCVGVGASERQLSDDAPTGVDSGEAAYIRVATNDGANEECVFKTNNLTLNTNTFHFTRVVAAVSNGTRLRVELRNDTAGGCAGVLLQTLTLTRQQNETSSTMAAIASASPSQLPANQTIRSVCVRVDDAADASNGGASALINSITVRQTATGADTNIESFSGNGATI